MKYDWKKINDQATSGLSITKYCNENNIATSTFYKNRRKFLNETTTDQVFIPVEVIEEKNSFISMSIDGHTFEFDSTLLDKVIGALK